MKNTPSTQYKLLDKQQTPLQHNKLLGSRPRNITPTSVQAEDEPLFARSSRYRSTEEELNAYIKYAYVR